MNRLGWMRWVAVLVLQGGALLAQALPLAIEPGEHAELVAQSEEARDDYRLALGSPRKVNGLWQFERSERLAGELWRTTWRFTRDRDADELHQRLRQQLQAYQGVLLYHCQGRACGASDQWANNAFQQRVLYGVGDTQRYSVVALEALGRYWLAALYSVRRGNGQPHLHLDLLRLTTENMLLPSPEALAEQLAQEGTLMLVATRLAQPALLNALVRVLARHPLWQLQLQGVGGDPVQAEEQASALAEALRSRGVAPGQLQEVAPRLSEEREGVELIRR